MTILDREAVVSDYLDAFVARDGSASSHALRRPAETWRAARALRALPEVLAAPSGSVDGRAVRSGLSRPHARRRGAAASLSAVIALPETPADFSLGSSKQTLRRKARQATKLGVTWSVVEDPAERRRLLDLSDAWERVNPRPEYRDASPQNDETLDFGLWLVAHDAHGAPLHLCAVPFDGEWAVLRLFRTIAEGNDASTARYLMTQVLAEQLIERGVRYLADTVHPAHLGSGLRHFQKMVGFSLLRVDLRPEPQISRALSTQRRYRASYVA